MCAESPDSETENVAKQDLQKTCRQLRSLGSLSLLLQIEHMKSSGAAGELDDDEVDLFLNELELELELEDDADVVEESDLDEVDKDLMPVRLFCSC